MKELKNTIDSIRRTLKSKNINVTSSEIGIKILDVCPNMEEWSSNARNEVINSFIIQESSLATTDISNLSVVDESPVESVELTTVDKSELITTTATNMGIVLSIEEVTAIAENFDYASQDADSYIQEIEDAITGFLVSKSQFTKQKISTMVQTIRDTASRLDNENSQLLTSGLGEVNTDIKRGAERFKSQVRTALKAFALPPSKSK
jgi:hypothetical protein